MNIEQFKLPFFLPPSPNNPYIINKEAHLKLSYATNISAYLLTVHNLKDFSSTSISFSLKIQNFMTH